MKRLLIGAALLATTSFGNECVDTLDYIVETKILPKKFKGRKDIKTHFVSCFTQEILHHLLQHKKQCTSALHAVEGVKFLLNYKKAPIIYGISYHCTRSTVKTMHSI